MAAALVTCVGEAIVDLVSTDAGSALKDARHFLKAAGGAPANVAVGLARLGTPSAFVGSVGDDPFGIFLVEFLRGQCVDVRGVWFDRTRGTRLAFVSLTERGDRDFAFWERLPADEALRLNERDYRRIAQSRIVHISSFMLINPSARAAVIRLADGLRRRGTQISFDPNLRLSLWESPVMARRRLLEMVRRSTIVKLNEEEAAFLTGKRSMEGAAAALLGHGVSLVVLTAGERGCSCFTKDHSVRVPGFAVHAVDTTGCGDAFLAALLHRLVSERGSASDLPVETLTEICRYANAVAALASLEYGAMTVPPPAVVERFLKES